MNLPKVKFKEMTLEENIEIIKWAYYEQNDSLNVHDYTVKFFPKLANLDNKLSQEEVYKKIEEVVTETYQKQKEEIKKESEKYNFLLEDINAKYMLELSNYLRVNWPNNIDIIEGTVGIIPIFPRYLDNFSFSIGTNIEKENLIEICAHEILHFLWFEKWKQIHPETPSIEYESPYITWQYSEMVTDPILNNKPFSEIFDFNERGYESFYEMYDGKDLVMDNLRNIYSKNINIEDRIEEGFEYIKNIMKLSEITKK